MSSETFEIIELANGDVALRRAGAQGEEPLVRIHFSEMSADFLREHKIAVARAMLEAGIDAVQNLDSVSAEFFDEEEPEPISHTIH